LAPATAKKIARLVQNFFARSRKVLMIFLAIAPMSQLQKTDMSAKMTYVFTKLLIKLSLLSLLTSYNMVMALAAMMKALLPTQPIGGVSKDAKGLAMLYIHILVQTTINLVTLASR
jgi:hypothetical protein